MRIKRTSLLNLKNDKEELEPLFVIEKEALPMYIKYINVQVPDIVERKKRSSRKIWISCALVTTVFVLTVAIVILVELSLNNKQRNQTLLLTDRNSTLKQHTNKTDYSLLPHKDTVKALLLPVKSVSCHMTCRRFSAFRFKSTCEEGKCRCHGMFYNRDTCLPVVSSCAIEKSKSTFRRRHKRQVSPARYICHSKRNLQQVGARVYVIAMYGSTIQTTSTIKLSSNETEDVILVVANFLETNWKVLIPNNIKIKKLFLMSNKYLRKSTIDVGFNKPEVTKLYSRVGYGDDRYNGYTVDLLRTINANIGPVSSFQGAKFQTDWIINV